MPGVDIEGHAATCQVAVGFARHHLLRDLPQLFQSLGGFSRSSPTSRKVALFVVEQGDIHGEGHGPELAIEGIELDRLLVEVG